MVMAGVSVVDTEPRGLRERLDPEILAKLKPVTLSGEQVLDVPELLKPLFPWGGLQRGWSVGVEGCGGWSLSMAMLGEALGAEGWLAVVGVPSFNVAAAAGFGVRLDRMLVVEDPGPGRWATVIATLCESVDVVAFAPGMRVGVRDQRRLTARAREQGTVLVHLDGGATWPSAIDLTLSVNTLRWDGIGDGHGHLKRRLVSVSAAGRRTGAAGAPVEMWLPDARGALGAATSIEATVEPAIESTVETAVQSTVDPAASPRSAGARHTHSKTPASPTPVTW